MTAVPRLIHEAVAEQARLRPSAVAVVHRGERVDYATLDAAAEAYARSLRAAGVGPGATVPVLLPRSARLVAALLAVLKCVAAYAALDRRWPPEHIGRVTAVLRSPGRGGRGRRSGAPSPLARSRGVARPAPARPAGITARPASRAGRGLPGRCRLLHLRQFRRPQGGSLPAPRHHPPPPGRPLGGLRARPDGPASRPGLLGRLQPGALGSTDHRRHLGRRGHGLPPPPALRRALADRLSRHLVPHSVHHRGSLPTTATGKVDRGGLLASLDPVPSSVRKAPSP